MLVISDPGAVSPNVIEAGGTKFSFLFIGGKAPEPRVERNKIIVGGQTISLDGKKIVLAK